MFFFMLIPCARFSRIDETDLDHFSARVFFKLSDAQRAAFSKMDFREIDFVFSGGGSRVKNHGFRRSLTFALALKIIQMKGVRFPGSWSLNLLAISIRIYVRSLWHLPFFN